MRTTLGSMMSLLLEESLIYAMVGEHALKIFPLVAKAAAAAKALRGGEPS